MANMSIAQENKKNKLYERFLNSNRISDLVAREILDGSSEQAKEILGILGFELNKFNRTRFGMASLSDVAGFYGIKTGHLYGVLRRCGFTHRDFPQDYRGVRDFDKITDRRTVTDIISPRMALAASALMFYGKVVPKDSRPYEVFDKLKLTTYYARALAKQEARNKLEEAEKPEVSANNVNVVQSDAVVSMSIDKFVEMVVLAAQKMNSTSSPDIKEHKAQKSEKPKRVSQKKTAASTRKAGGHTPLPENWDDIVAKRQSGEISTKEAIAISGLPHSSFYYHYNQAINN